MLPPGATATLILAGTLAVGYTLGRFAALAHERKHKVVGGRARLTHTIIMFLLAAVFWSWAALRVSEGISDAGAITFFVALVAAVTLLLSPKCIHGSEATLASVACALPAVNYLVPSPVALFYGHIGIGLYFALGGVVWTLLALAAPTAYRGEDASLWALLAE